MNHNSQSLRQSAVKILQTPLSTKLNQVDQLGRKLHQLLVQLEEQAWGAESHRRPGSWRHRKP